MGVGYRGFVFAAVGVLWAVSVWAQEWRGPIFGVRRQDEQQGPKTQPVGKELWRLRGHVAKVNSVGFSPDGQMVVSGGGGQSNLFGGRRALWMDCATRLWDLETGKEVRRFEGHQEAVTSVSLSGDGKWLLTGSSDKTVRMWDVGTGRELRKFAGVNGAMSRDGALVAVATAEGAIDVYDARTGEQVQRMVGHLYGTKVMAFSVDGKRLVSGGTDGAIRAWDVRTGKAMRTARVGSEVRCLVYVGGSVRGVVGDGVCVWEVGKSDAPRMVKIGEEIEYAAISADGKWVAFMGQGGVRMWDVEAGRELDAPVAAGGRGVVFAASEEGRKLVSTSVGTTEVVVYEWAGR